ncbi:MAG TPA: hypothetical protein VEZ14_08290 [Dehalococcoidia bacterium]|nr:hypothetical protein [Dehalococcoidia bacterium]
MNQRFAFADAFWFRVPLKAVVVGLCVFGTLTLWPALTSGSVHDEVRAAFGFGVLGWFALLASVFTVAMNDCRAEIDGRDLLIRFEAFFNVRVPLADIAGVRAIDPRPRWRYRFGLSTNFTDRISCSHGGPMVEIELARACRAKLWPRRIDVMRFWLGVPERAAFIDAVLAAAGGAADEAA